MAVAVVKKQVVVFHIGAGIVGGIEIEVSVSIGVQGG
jgi:hypothetical protein